MSNIDDLCAAISEAAIAQHVGIAHDEARLAYHLPGNKNTVNNFDEFNALIADYYNYHLTQCVTHGGGLAHFEAAGRASEILESEYKHQGGDLMSAYRDAHDGTNGGMRIILDIIADHLKTESAERYVRAAFHRYVDPASWDERVEIIRQFFDRNPHVLPLSIDKNRPERYAQNYDELIKAFMDGLKKFFKSSRKY